MEVKCSREEGKAEKDVEEKNFTKTARNDKGRKEMCTRTERRV